MQLSLIPNVKRNEKFLIECERDEQFIEQLIDFQL